MQIKTLCFAKPNVDYTKYGFKDDGRDCSYWFNNTRRMYFDKKNLRVYFNCMTTEVLFVFYLLAKDNVIEFKQVTKAHTITLTNEEYEVIMKMRGGK